MPALLEKEAQAQQDRQAHLEILEGQELLEDQGNQDQMDHRDLTLLTAHAHHEPEEVVEAAAVAVEEDRFQPESELLEQPKAEADMEEEAEVAAEEDHTQAEPEEVEQPKVEADMRQEAAEVAAGQEHTQLEVEELEQPKVEVDMGQEEAEEELEDHTRQEVEPAVQLHQQEALIHLEEQRRAAEVEDTLLAEESVAMRHPPVEDRTRLVEAQLAAVEPTPAVV